MSRSEFVQDTHKAPPTSMRSTAWKRPRASDPERHLTDVPPIIQNAIDLDTHFSDSGEDFTPQNSPFLPRSSRTYVEVPSESDDEPTLVASQEMIFPPDEPEPELSESEPDELPPVPPRRSKRKPAAPKRMAKRTNTEVIARKKSARKNPRGLKAIAEIKEHQSSDKLLVPKTAMYRLVKNVSGDLCKVLRINPVRWTKSALEALHDAAEAEMVDLLNMTNHATVHCKRVTITVRDMRLIRRIQRRNE